jgi:hypothetical protein
MSNGRYSILSRNVLSDFFFAYNPTPDGGQDYVHTATGPAKVTFHPNKGNAGLQTPREECRYQYQVE